MDSDIDNEVPLEQGQSSQNNFNSPFYYNDTIHKVQPESIVQFKR